MGARLARTLVTTLLALGLARAAWAARPHVEVRGASLSTRDIESCFGERGSGDSAFVSAGMAKLVAALQEHGHLDARAHAERIQDGGWRVTVSEGPRYRLVAIDIDTTSPLDSTEFTAGLGLSPGGWAAPGAIGAAMSRALDHAVGDGYAYARLTWASFDWDSAGARARLSGALGPRVTVADVTLQGLDVTRPALVRRVMGPLAGRPFDPATAEAARARAVQLGLFRSVTFAGLQGRGDWSQGDLVYRFDEPHYHHIEGAVGMQSDRQIVGLARIELDNLAGTGRAALLHWESRGRGRQDFTARYAEPFVLGTPVRLELALAQQLEDTLWTRTVWGGQAVFGLGARQRGELGLEQEHVVQPAGEVREASLQTTRSAFQVDRRDDPRDPRRGWWVRIEGAESFKTEHLRATPTTGTTDGTRRRSNVGTVQTSLDLLHPLRSSRGAGLALELRAAGRFSSATVLEPYERLGLGGATSLRGFDERQFLVDRYALSRLEWRLPVGAGGQRVALFWDHAFDATHERLADGNTRLARGSHDGVGFGLRLRAGGGLAAIDYGLEPSRPPTEGKVHLRLVSSF